MVYILCPFLVAGIVTASAPPFTVSSGHKTLEIIIPPDTVNTLEIDIPAILSKLYRDPAVAVSRPFINLPAYCFKYSRIFDRQCKLISLGTS